jgi:hypothetical protein
MMNTDLSAKTSDDDISSTAKPADSAKSVPRRDLRWDRATAAIIMTVLSRVLLDMKVSAIAPTISAAG